MRRQKDDSERGGQIAAMERADAAFFKALLARATPKLSRRYWPTSS